MMKRGQAAMEFLMTYGWAILVVLAAIGALAYFGVLSPDKFVPESCTLSAGVSCDGFKVMPTETQIVMRNGMGKDITINSVQVGDCSISGEEIAFDNGQQITVTLEDCSNGEAGERFDGDIVIGYTEDGTGLTKTHTGTIASKIEAEGT